MPQCAVFRVGMKLARRRRVGIVIAQDSVKGHVFCCVCCTTRNRLFDGPQDGLECGRQRLGRHEFPTVRQGANGGTGGTPRGRSTFRDLGPRAGRDRIGVEG